MVHASSRFRPSVTAGIAAHGNRNAFSRDRAVTGPGPPIRFSFAGGVWGIVALMSFWGPLDISDTASVMTVGLDWRVAVKLAISGLAALLAFLGWCTLPEVRRGAMTLPALAIGGILCLALLATPTAISEASLPTTMVNAVFLLFMVTAVSVLELPQLARALLTGVTASMALALFLYVFVPAYGVFPETLGGGVVINRLGAVAHPNGTARSMAIGLLLTGYLFRRRELAGRYAVPLAGCFVLALYLAWSRTAFLAGGLAMVALYADRLATRTGVVVLATGMLAVFVAVTATFLRGKEDEMTRSVLAKASKSGDVQEITSGTGRSDIWSEVARLIAQRPIIGHGFNAAPILLLDYSQSTHNAVLHATLVAGIGGGVLMACLLLWNASWLVRTDELLIRGAIAFLFVACLTEDTVLETFPGPATLLWLTCCFHPLLVRIRSTEHVSFGAAPANPAWGLPPKTDRTARPEPGIPPGGPAVSR